VAAVIVATGRLSLPRCLGAILIGLSVAGAIILVAPISQAGLNPARDLAPRLLAASLGATAACDLPVLAVYVLAPIGGALAGSRLASLTFERQSCPC
jgi:glycerol uptake facilitator protein